MRDNTLPIYLALVWLGVMVVCGTVFVGCAPERAPNAAEVQACQAASGVPVAGAGHHLICINKSALAASGT